jgi:hypothetical protein
LTNITAIDQLKTDIPRLQQEIEDKAKELIKPALREFFEKYDFVAEVRWQAYVPYFNDGEACEFSVGEVCLFTETDSNDPDQKNDYWESGEEFSRHARQQYWKDGGYVPNPNADPQYAAAQSDANAIVHSIPDDLHKQMFGEHVRITVTRERGVEVEEYADHD